MGILDSVKGLLGGSGRDVIPVPMLDGEHPLRTVIAQRSRLVGGKLILTDRRLIFSPWNTLDIAEVLTWGLRVTRSPGAQLLNKAVESIGDPRSADLASIAQVEVGDGKPPRLTIIGRDAVRTNFAISADLSSTIFSPKNITARDEMASAIRAALVA